MHIETLRICRYILNLEAAPHPFSFPLIRFEWLIG